MTNSDSSNQAPDSSSSDLTAASIRCEATLELGRALTKELELDQSVDTLGRWMAHYIAELIHDAENASAEERPAKMQACSEAILNLWRHRQELPNGKRPFEEVEPILRSLKSLDPDDDTPRYFRSVRHAVDETTETDEAKSWLKLVNNFDYTARILIRYCLTQAAQSAFKKSAKWVALAEAAVADDGIESPIIRIIAGETELLEESDPDEIQKKQLQDRIARLEGFIEMANAVVAKLREHLQQSPSSESNS